MFTTRRLLPLAVAALVLTTGACSPVASRSSDARATKTDASTTATADRDTLITEPAEGMGPIYGLIRGARHSIDLTMYELADAKAESLLDAAAARGVDVRVLLDTNRERARNTSAYDELSAHGVHVRWASTVYPATHEKTLAVDGRVAAIMTLNWTSEYYDDTRDFAVVDRNGRDVAAIQTVFDADFAHRTLPRLPDGADLIWSPGAASALLDLIAGARTTLLVENEEMSDRSLVDALVAAARRGVAVTVVMTSDDEYDAELNRLARAGVKVRVYAEDAALYIHAKVMVADGLRAGVGSQNFSAVSLDDNRELGIVLSNKRIAASLAQTIEADAAGGRPLGGGT